MDVSFSLQSAVSLAPPDSTCCKKQYEGIIEDQEALRLIEDRVVKATLDIFALEEDGGISGQRKAIAESVIKARFGEHSCTKPSFCSQALKEIRKEEERLKVQRDALRFICEIRRLYPSSWFQLVELRRFLQDVRWAARSECFDADHWNARLQQLVYQVVGAFVFPHHTCLTWAVCQGSPLFLNWFLEHGENPNEANRYDVFPIQLALNSSNMKYAQLLYQHGAKLDIVPKKGPTLLTRAVSMRDVDVVNWLLERNADVNLLDGLDESPLMVALHVSDTVLLNRLHEKGALVNEVRPGCMSLLTSAISERNVEGVQWLLQKGADVDLADGGGVLPIVLASSLLFNRIPTLLIEHVGDVNRVLPDRKTFLNYAVSANNFYLAKWLLENGANPSLADGGGVLPIMEAVRLESVVMLELLVSYGVDVNTTLPGQPSALALARMLDQTSHVIWLKEHGALSEGSFDG